jgi:hypothetical protein
MADVISRDVAPVATSTRPLWHALAALAAILPAAGAAFATRGVINTFSGMAETGSGGIGTAAMGMYEANRPLVAAAALAAALACGLAVVLRRKPGAFPGLMLSLAPLLACVPALLLWMTESYVLDVLAGSVTGSIADASQRISTLVTASFGSAVVVILVVIAAFAVSLARLARPKSASALPPVAVWAVMAVLLAGLAILFYVRSSYLYQAALTGQL